MNCNYRIKNYLFPRYLKRRSVSPVEWVGYGRITSFLAKVLPPKQPPLLILSLPRSGSSWVGEILGSAANALYLREPITQSSMQQLGANKAILHIDKTQLDPAIQRFANDAFNGIPDFPSDIVHDVGQWNLRTRSQKRIVIKEVNPLAAGWLISEFNPQVIFLVRHPAAVAASYHKLGWLVPPISEVISGLDQVFSSTRNKAMSFIKTNDFWINSGYMQGGCLLYEWAYLNTCPNAMCIRYEDLCEDPIGQFHELFRATGLTWSYQTENLIREKSKGDDRYEPFSTSRKTKSMPREWTSYVCQDMANRLRTSFSQFALPWYNSDDDWSTKLPSLSSKES